MPMCGWLERGLQDFGGEDVEAMCRRFTAALVGAAHAHVPRGTREGKPAWFWWSPEADEAVRKRKEARKRAKRSGRREDVPEWKREVRRCRYTCLLYTSPSPRDRG